jgi:hypothetical protein
MKVTQTMNQIYTPAAIQGSAAGNFHQVFRWRLSDFPSWVTKIQLLGIILFIISGIPLMALALWNGTPSGSISINVREIGTYLAVFASWPAILILHELTHGLTMAMFGARPRYGAQFKKLLFYATAPGYGFRRNAYIIVTLAPLILLSIPLVLGTIILRGTTGAMLTAFCMAFNIGGAAGDLMITRMVLGYSKSTYIVDEKDGFRVLTRDKRETQIDDELSDG